MTRRNLLTDPAVNSKKKTPGYHLDGHGLYLQVSQSGSRSWIFRYTKDKRTREMGLGSVDALTLAQARERARLCRLQLAEDKDPIDLRNAARAAQRLEKQAEVARSKSFKDSAQEYLEGHQDQWKNAKHGQQWINTLRSHAFPKLGNRQIDTITKQDIVTALTPIWKSKAETASRVLQRIRLVFNYAAAKDYCTGRDGEFWAQVKLALGSNDRSRGVEHHSSCPHKDVGALLSAVSRNGSGEVIKLALNFIVLNASRSGEVRGAMWKEIDEDAGIWTIPPERMKSARPHQVPLSKEARAVLAQVKKLHKPKSGDSLIFPSTQGKVVSDMVFTQMLRRMKAPYTVHGFRASFRTWGSEKTEHAHEMLEFALAHVVGDKTVQAYARSSMVERRRELMQDWADYVEEGRKQEWTAPKPATEPKKRKPAATKTPTADALEAEASD